MAFKGLRNNHVRSEFPALSSALERPSDGLINMERAPSASAAAAHAAWKGRGRLPPSDYPLGADDVDVVGGDNEIVVRMMLRMTRKAVMRGRSLVRSVAE